MIADPTSGYSWYKPLGKSTTSKEVAGVTRKIFLKCGIPFRVRCDGGPEFRGPFQEIIAYTSHILQAPHTTALQIDLQRGMWGSQRHFLRSVLTAKQTFKKVFSISITVLSR